jgi:hypothetical protein
MVDINEERTNFRCSYCGQLKAIRFLADTLLKKTDLTALKNKIQSKEELREEYRKQVLNSGDEYVNKTLNEQVLKLEKEIAELQKQANTAKSDVCSLCMVQGKKRVSGQTFTCDFCQQKKIGNGLKQHIGG